MDWDKLRIFHIVAKAGSLTEAGKELNLAQSSIGRHIKALEDSLKTPLFFRHSRGLQLTEQGELLYQTSQEVYEKLTRAKNNITDMKELAEGPLVVTSTNFFGDSWLTETLSDFILENPDIQISLKLADTELDLSMREADIAIRMRQPVQNDLIQRHLTTFRFHLYASKDYLEKNGTPKTVSDLHEHHLICYTKGKEGPFHDDNWILKLAGIELDKHDRITLTTNLYSMLIMTYSGVGISCLPDYMGQEYPDLVQILPDVERPSLNAYLCYPEELKHSERIKRFKDFIVKRVYETNF